MLRTLVKRRRSAHLFVTNKFCPPPKFPCCLTDQILTITLFKGSFQGTFCPFRSPIFSPRSTLAFHWQSLLVLLLCLQYHNIFTGLEHYPLLVRREKSGFQGPIPVLPSHENWFSHGNKAGQKRGPRMRRVWNKAAICAILTSGWKRGIWGASGKGR